MVLALTAIGIFLILVYFVPDVCSSVRFLIPENTMRNAMRDYMDDDDLSGLINIIQKDVSLLYCYHVRYAIRHCFNCSA